MLINEKLNQASRILTEQKIDCWITFVRESNINHDPMLDFLIEKDVTWDSAFIVTSAGEKIAIVGEGDKANIEDLGVYGRIHSYLKGIRNVLQEVIQQLNPGLIAVNFSEDSEISDGLTHGMYLKIYKILEEINFHNKLISAAEIISTLRGRKSNVEIGYIKEAIFQTLEIFDLVSSYIKPGLTEKEIAAFMMNEVKKRRLKTAWDEKYCPGVFTGPDTNVAHYCPTDRKTERGHVLNMDFGVKVNGYCSDLQRTWYLLKEGEKNPPEEVQRGFDVIKASIELARKALRPGVTGKEVDKVARDYIVSKGYGEFPHGLGHQVGRFAHDGYALLGPPWEKYSSKVSVPIEEGMVFTIEPKIAIKNRGVVTIEEMVLVTKNETEYLSRTQERLFLVE